MLRRGDGAKDERRERRVEGVVWKRQTLGATLHEAHALRNVFSLRAFKHLAAQLTRDALRGVWIEREVKTRARADFENAA